MHPYISHYYTKDNLKIIYAIDKTNPVVSVQLFIKTGSAKENDNEAGYSHLLEHLVFKSTDKYPANSINDKAAEIGSSINAYTEYDLTCFSINTLSEYVNIAIELLLELAFKSNFNDYDFKNERKVVLEEMKQYQNDPEDFFIEQIPPIVLKNNPYSKSIIGNKNSLLNATADDLRAFYKKHYKTENAFLCIAGDIELCNIIT